MGLNQVTGAACVTCGGPAPASAEACPSCNEAGLLEYLIDLEDAARTLDRPSLERREPWMWRYKELLPLDDLAELPPLQVGMTPTWGAPRLAQWAGVSGLWVKDEGRNPTGSAFDRAAALLVATARESGRKAVCLASDSDEGPSLACLAASFGLGCVVVGSPEIEGAAQASRFGAVVGRTRGALFQARSLCHAAALRHRWLDGSAHPLVLEGLKTAGLELAEQLAERPPRWVVVADGTGLFAASVHRGLCEMKALGVARSVPQLLLVQPGGGTLAAAWRKHEEGADPPSRLALRAVKAGGAILEADEPAGTPGAELAGVDPGRWGVLALAGLRRAVRDGVIDPAETVAVILRGRAAAAACSVPEITSDADLDRLATALARR